jgi:hypothetical protein
VSLCLLELLQLGCQQRRTRMMIMGTSLNMSAVVRVSCLRSRLQANTDTPRVRREQHSLDHQHCQQQAPG